MFMNFGASTTSLALRRCTERVVVVTSAGARVCEEVDNTSRASEASHSDANTMQATDW